ncbi:flagellar basal body rod protein FlgB [Cohaesibacter celericrescens]|uniref:Flagellar basal body rod protein FlgB n=1 Tax=Cohaesibacter celericrescens TaxID=2067669 RepID=A0A2N5XLW9_9HYPH|nr:flagellar basal body rod protein FlgB [Cohaesibacter celericrescens]PLW75494.1 flagellar basal body rod protein FlgB [Cohaesibacter celericrescens]PLW78901.1 flagellar basal body rod protein FlgB [Cohaesibacter celericrescens]
MEPVYFMKLASKHQDWLAAREATIAQNVANANTPGYRAKDVESFSALFDKAHIQMRSTQAGHMTASAAVKQGQVVEKKDSWDVTYSGNSVSLEQEMMKANEVARSHALTTNLMKSMHSMMLLSTKVQ